MSEERIPFNIKMFEKNEPVGEQVDPSTNIKFEEEKWDGNVISIKGLHQIFNEGKPNEYPLFVDFNLDVQSLRIKDNSYPLWAAPDVERRSYFVR